MKRWLFLFLFPFLIQAQETTLVSSTPLKADTFIGVDTYDALYYIKDNIIYKEASFGNFNFNDFQLGSITYVDIINPLKLVVFYADFNTVVFLDNKLNEIDRIDFNDVRGFNSAFITNAGNNRVWIYDNDRQQLLLYNYLFDQIIEISPPLDSPFVSFSSDFNYAHLITEKDLKTYSVKGGLVFIQEKNNFSKIAQYNENLVAFTKDKLYFKTKNEPVFKVLKAPQINVHDFYLTQNFLYVFDRINLYNLSIKQIPN